MTPDQQLAPPHKISSAREPKPVLGELRPIERSPISSPVSQNAAAILFDLRSVDIR
jgi:hypothetical protein